MMVKRATGSFHMELAADLENISGRADETEQGGGQSVMANVNGRQPSGQATRHLGSLAQMLADGFGVASQFRRRGFQVFSQVLEFHFQSGQSLAQVVVNVLPDPSLLTLGNL